MMKKKLEIINKAMAVPEKSTCLENGKNAIITNKNKTPCLTIFEKISTGVVNL